MVQRDAEILPEWRSRAWVVRRKQKSEHIHDSKSAGESHPDARKQRNSDREFSVGGKESDGRTVWQHEMVQDWDHKRVGGPVLQKAVDPGLKSAVESKFCAEDFVLGEDQKQAADRDAQSGEGNRVSCCRIFAPEHVRDCSRALRDNWGNGNQRQT